MSAPKPGPPTFNPRTLMDLYIREQYEELSDRFLEILGYFHGTTFYGLDTQAQYYIDAFTKVFLTLFTQPEYRLADRHVLPFVRLNLTISNLVAMSTFKTTDPFLELLRRQPANYAKILALYSARNTAKFDRTGFFDAHVDAASLWYCLFGQAYRGGLVNPDVVANLQEHYTFRDDRLKPIHEVQELYFGSTYVDGKCDREIKTVVNNVVRQVTAAVTPTIKNTPAPKKIAVLSGMWHAGHSVYRNYYAYLRTMQGYHMTFFQLSSQGQPEIGLFDDVQRLDIVDGVFNIDPIRENDFMVAYYPDIGMTPHSIFLANMRLAPIQIASPGHSVSTWGADIDYFISGVDCELPEKPERNYSERLVLLPGAGVIHNRPLYEPTNRTPDDGQFIINCPWYAQKINYRFACTLKKIVDGAQRPIRFRLFVGSALARQNDFLPFARDLEAVVGGRYLEIVPALAYRDYMAKMEEGHIAIDSYHFGGCNTVADSLWLRKPTVTWEGDKWYARIGAQMVRTAGFPELAATSEDDYVDKVLALINDDQHRTGIEKKLRKVKLIDTVFGRKDAKYFQKAIEYLIENHQRLKQEESREAIRIER